MFLLDGQMRPKMGTSICLTGVFGCKMVLPQCYFFQSSNLAQTERNLDSLGFSSVLPVLNVQSITWVRRFPSNSRISSLRRRERSHHRSSKMFQTEKPFVLANSVREGDQEVVPLTFDHFLMQTPTFDQTPITIEL